MIVAFPTPQITNPAMGSRTEGMLEVAFEQHRLAVLMLQELTKGVSPGESVEIGRYKVTAPDMRHSWISLRDDAEDGDDAQTAG